MAPVIQPTFQPQNNIISIVQNSNESTQFSILNKSNQIKVTPVGQTSTTGSNSIITTSSASNSILKPKTTTLTTVTTVTPTTVTPTLVKEFTMPKLEAPVQNSEANEAKISLKIGSWKTGESGSNDRLISLPFVKDKNSENEEKTEKNAEKNPPEKTPDTSTSKIRNNDKKNSDEKKDIESKKAESKPVKVESKKSADGKMTPKEPFRARTSSIGIIMSPVISGRRRKRTR